VLYGGLQYTNYELWLLEISERDCVHLLNIRVFVSCFIVVSIYCLCLCHRTSCSHSYSFCQLSDVTLSITIVLNCYSSFFVSSTFTLGGSRSGATCVLCILWLRTLRVLTAGGRGGEILCCCCGDSVCALACICVSVPPQFRHMLRSMQPSLGWQMTNPLSARTDT
jgi:hypothetical protein